MKIWIDNIIFSYKKQEVYLLYGMKLLNDCCVLV